MGAELIVAEVIGKFEIERNTGFRRQVKVWMKSIPETDIKGL